MAAGSSSKFVVYAALIGNLLVALTKFGAAYWTGSSVMLSEAVHSLIDTTNQALLLYGLHRAALPPDEEHPLGHGRELYFWSFVVAFLMFTLGAGVTFYEGVIHIGHPVEIVDPTVSYAVLGLSFAFESASWIVALREFRKAKGALGYIEAFRRSKNPPIFLVLFEDTAALCGLAIAFAGTLAAEYFANPIYDGVASIGISIVLGTTALVLARESKGLLIGESASGRVNASILKLAQEEPGIERAHGVMTTHLAPDQVVVTLSLEFADHLTVPDVEARVARLETRIRAGHPDVIAVFTKLQSHGAMRLMERELERA